MLDLQANCSLETLFFDLNIVFANFSIVSYRARNTQVTLAENSQMKTKRLNQSENAFSHTGSLEIKHLISLI